MHNPSRKTSHCFQLKNLFPYILNTRVNKSNISWPICKRLQHLKNVPISQLHMPFFTQLTKEHNNKRLKKYYLIIYHTVINIMMMVVILLMMIMIIIIITVSVIKISFLGSAGHCNQTHTHAYTFIYNNVQVMANTYGVSYDNQSFKKSIKRKKNACSKPKTKWDNMTMRACKENKEIQSQPFWALLWP